MSIIEEVIAIELFIKKRFPASKTGKQTIPKVPAADTFYIRFLDDSRETETPYYYRADREYQIVYFGQWPEQIIPKMDKLAADLYQTEVVADGIRVGSFSFSQPVETDGGLYASVGILQVVVREAREQPTYPLINHIGVRKV